jgi:anti-anti-sigma factor
MPNRFQMRQSRDPDGVLRLALSGEFDLAVSDRVHERLAELRRSGAPVRLDLSRLHFIDSTGVRIVVMAIAASRRNGWQLEVEPEVMPGVRRPLELLGLSSYLWRAEL